MLKKIILSLCFLPASVSFLFAIDKGSLILYPQAGFGASDALCSVWDGARLSDEVTGAPGSPRIFKDANMPPMPGISWSIGCGLDYVFTDSLALTSGIFIDATSFVVIYKKANAALASNMELRYSFIYLTVPAGLHFYGDVFVLGGGLYLDVPLSGRRSAKYMDRTTDTNIDGLKTMGLFIDVGVFNSTINDSNNTLMAFFRFKNDLTNAYKKEDAVSNIKRISLNMTVAYGFTIN